MILYAILIFPFFYMTHFRMTLPICGLSCQKVVLVYKTPLLADQTLIRTNKTEEGEAGRQAEEVTNKDITASSKVDKVKVTWVVPRYNKLPSSFRTRQNYSSQISNMIRYQLFTGAPLRSGNSTSSHIWGWHTFYSAWAFDCMVLWVAFRLTQPSWQWQFQYFLPSIFCNWKSAVK